MWVQDKCWGGDIFLSQVIRYALFLVLLDGIMVIKKRALHPGFPGSVMFFECVLWLVLGVKE